MGEAGERAHEEPGREHEHEGERDLDHHQRAAQGARSFSREARALLLDRLRRRHSSGAQGGDHSEEQGGPDGHDQREGEHAIVKGKVEEDEGVPAGDLADQETAAPLGEGQAEEGAGHREEKGLAQELPGQARPRRAQGQSGAQFPTAGVGAGHLEAREVRARDEQDQAHHDHEGEQGLGVAAPDLGEAVRRRDQGEPVAEKARPVLGPPGVCGHRGFADLGLHGAQGPGGGLDRLAGFEPGEDLEPPEGPTVELALADGLKAVDHADGHRHVVGASHRGPEEPGRGHPHDREGHAVQDEGPADHVGRAAVPPLPERVADDGHRALRTAAAAIVLGGEGPPQDRGNPQHVEEAAAGQDPLHELGLSARREVESGVAAGHGTVEEAVLALADLLPDGVRPGTALQPHELSRVAHGKGAQDQAVEEREDRRVGADAQGQRQRGDEGEDGALAEHACAVAQVLAEVLEEAGAARVPAGLLHLLEPPQLELRATAGFGLAQTVANVICGLAFEVIPKLGVELDLEATPAQEPSQHAHHAPASRAARIRAIASVRRRQFASSVPSWARPFAVSR